MTTPVIQARMTGCLKFINHTSVGTGGGSTLWLQCCLAKNAGASYWRCLFLHLRNRRHPLSFIYFIPSPRVSSLLTLQLPELSFPMTPLDWPFILLSPNFHEHLASLLISVLLLDGPTWAHHLWTVKMTLNASFHFAHCLILLVPKGASAEAYFLFDWQPQCSQAPRTLFDIISIYPLKQGSCFFYCHRCHMPRLLTISLEDILKSHMKSHNQAWVWWHVYAFRLRWSTRTTPENWTGDERPDTAQVSGYLAMQRTIFYSKRKT